MNIDDSLNFELGIGPERLLLPACLQRRGFVSVKVLGKGNNGEAHLLYHAEKKSYIVAKHILIRQRRTSLPSEVRSEIELLKACDHPNIVKYLEYIEEYDHLYVLMEYEEGDHLYSELSRRKIEKAPYAQSEALRIFTQIAAAVRYLHLKRILLHRDISAQNVFLTKNGTVKLGDFGMARIVGANDTSVCGAYYYESPELILGQSHTFKSDVWALGVILYELLTLKLPFSDGVLQESVRDRDPIPLSSSHCSESVRELVEGMLRKDPLDRYDIHKVLSASCLQGYLEEGGSEEFTQHKGSAAKRLSSMLTQAKEIYQAEPQRPAEPQRRLSMLARAKELIEKSQSEGGLPIPLRRRHTAFAGRREQQDKENLVPKNDTVNHSINLLVRTTAMLARAKELMKNEVSSIPELRRHRVRTLVKPEGIDEDDKENEITLFIVGPQGRAKALQVAPHSSSLVRVMAWLSRKFGVGGCLMGSGGCCIGTEAALRSFCLESTKTTYPTLHYEFP